LICRPLSLDLEFTDDRRLHLTHAILESRNPLGVDQQHPVDFP
jgi:hypothetical protein